jgi:hypothetical protein
VAARKIHRFSGRKEVWFNARTNVLVMRDSPFSFQRMDLNDPIPRWKFGAFKEAWTFDFYNGSKYLQRKGFKLVDRVGKKR